MLVGIFLVSNIARTIRERRHIDSGMRRINNNVTLRGSEYCSLRIVPHYRPHQRAHQCTEFSIFSPKEFL
jgi:hypothetical protein